jgi:hypothetical protein
MKLEEQLIRLNEEEIFGKEHSVDIEESDVMKNLGTLGNMINEAVENLRGCNRLLYEDAEALTKLEMESMKWLGAILEKLQKYM